VVAAPAAPLPPAVVISPEDGGGGGGGLPKVEEKKSNLLQQIREGKRLKKVEESDRKRAPVDTGGFNVAAILQRRIALEFSSDEEGSGNSDWDDDSDWED